MIFQSDHGYLLGQHFAWQKMLLFEEACRIPMIVSYPGMANRGAIANGITESIDMYPTVCDLAGLKGPSALEGKSFRDLLEHPDHHFKDVAYSILDSQNGEWPVHPYRPLPLYRMGRWH